jgi:signal transduction histidine kinase
LLSVQAGLAVLALALCGGALVLLALRLRRHVAVRRRTGVSPRTASLLWAVSDALGDAAVLLDGRGHIAAASPSARARLAGERGAAGLLGRSVEEVLGPDAALLRRGLERGPASGRLDRPGAADGVAAVLLRVSLRPVRDLLVLRWERRTPPPLPGPAADPGPAQRGAVRAELGALGAALLRPIERASTAAGLLRLGLTGAGSEELRRIEDELAGVERKLRWLHAAGRAAPRHEGPVDLAALVGELVGKAVPGRARLRAQLAPTSAWADPGRLRTVLREVLRAAYDDLPAGAELWVRVAPRSGNAVLELVPASEATEAAALARALVVPEGGEVVVEAAAGHGGLCRISFPAGEPR